MAQLELWGGVECTVNRIGDLYFDQIMRSGHHDRVDDLDRFASLGVTAMRYPVLWERVAPEGLERADWRWTDERLARLRELGIRPIVGLLHHGSGPLSTSLIDPEFPRKFAEYAARAAERYPWVEDYTPINEPLTTARFSGLYGHWYPHRRNESSFITALVNQITATVLAMEAIRRVNPRARLIQTEDGGRTYSTPALARQAAYENHRRWLTCDLLTGRVIPGHPLYERLKRIGHAGPQLDWLAANPCPPDIIGLNYYFTSDRFLDERLELYPEWSHGGNRRRRYADVEAVRATAEELAGHRGVLVEAWERYRLPVAITEVHAGCSREDQVRWLLEAWAGARAAREDGADVRAITSWALLGSLDWNSLLTRTDGTYEPGAFDIRSDPPRPTAVARVLRQLADGAEPHAVAHQRGWWRRPQRVTCGAFARSAEALEAAAESSGPPLVITGASGTLGSALVRAARARGLCVVGLSRQDVDVTSHDAVRLVIERLRPWAVINAAGHVRVDDAEADAHECLRVNTDAPGAMAAACAAVGARFATFSSDLVFDGSLRRPYVESDRPVPVNVYGISKLEAEARVLGAYPEALVIRTSAFFGPVDDYNFVTVALREIAAGRPFRAASDTVVSPTYVPDLVDATLDLVLDGEAGIWHLANRGELTWYELALDVAQRAGLDASLVTSAPMRLLAGPAPRPAYSVLGTTRGALLPTLDNALERYLRVAPFSRENKPEAVPS